MGLGPIGASKKALERAGIGPNENVYAELGTTWWNLMRTPTQAAHVLGKLLATLGPDNVLWGTDTIWYGSPQSQIEAFRTFEITPELQEQFGYPALTPDVKAKILGLNAARLYGIDPTAKRQAIKADKLTLLREEYRQNPEPSNTQYGWVWVEDGREPTIPVGQG